MSFFTRKKPTIESFRWNTTGWTIQKTDASSQLWKNDTGDLAVQKFAWQEPTGLPNSWRHVESLREHLAQTRPPQLASVSVDVFSLAAGISCAQFVSKEFMPEPSLGNMYSGMITMPFVDFYCNVHFIAMEQGTTGMREAALMAAGLVQLPKQDVIPTIENEEQLQAMYRQARKGRPKLLGTDDEKWDAQFPTHPVSRVREYLRGFRASLTVDPSVKKCNAFGG